MRTTLLLISLVSAAAPAARAEDEDEVFAPFVDWYDKAPRGDVVQVVGQVKFLLKEDWTSKTATKEKVIGRYITASKLCPDDGRLPFAWGLYFWKTGDHEKARSAFEKTTAVAPNFLPGHQAAILANLELGDAERALAKTADFRQALRQAEDLYPSAKQRAAASEWLGRIVAYGKGSAVKTATFEAWAEAEQQCATLPDDLKTAFERGREAAQARGAELKTTLGLPIGKLQAEFQQRLTDVETELTACEGRIAELQKEMRGNSQEISEALTKQRRGMSAISQLKQQACRHQSEAARLQRTSYGQTITEREPQFKRERQSDGSYRQVPNGFKTVKVKLPETAEETARRLRDIQSQKTAATEKLQTAANIQGELRALREESTSLTKDADQFRNNIAQEWSSLHATQRSLKAQRARIEAWQSDPKAFTAYTRSVEAYVSWDIESLREELLDSFQDEG